MVALTVVIANADDLHCLTEQQRKDFAIYELLRKEANEALNARQEKVEALVTPEAIREYQQSQREFFRKQLGDVDYDSPLNAQTVRTIKGDDYDIECVTFDAEPHHRIAANFYLPHGVKKPIPAVVVSSGHSRTAKTADYNQRFGIMMAKQGMAALCFDPIGQGERSQILTETGEVRFRGTTTEHFMIGIGSTLVGRNTASFRIRDASRAIDYVCSRPEVDKTKIGFTGCSGGGTLTSYIMALDDRVTCAAPACYLTTFRHLMNTIGPQDAEQNIFGQLSFGMDQADYVLMRVPRPTLISSTTDDFFSIEGSWDTFRQSKRVYGNLGFPERVDLVEMPGNHGVKPQNLATIGHWMKRWLLGVDQNIPAVDLPVLEPAKLLCTKSGQVAEFEDELTTFEINAMLAEQLSKQREKLWKTSSHDELRSKIRGLLNISDKIDSPKFEDLGRIEGDKYHIDKFVLTTSSGRLLPGLTFHPPAPVDDAYLYLHEDGKLGDSEADGPIEKLVNEGYAVVGVDLSGQGETRTDKPDELLGSWKTYNAAYLLGRSLTGIRVEDTLAAADFVARYQKEEGSRRKVHLVGSGKAGIIALHAAALHPRMFETVTLCNAPKNWIDIVSNPAPSGHLEYAVHGALRVYDLPVLESLCTSLAKK